MHIFVFEMGDPRVCRVYILTTKSDRSSFFEISFPFIIFVFFIMKDKGLNYKESTQVSP